MNFTVHYMNKKELLTLKDKTFIIARDRSVSLSLLARYLTEKEYRQMYKLINTGKIRVSRKLINELPDGIYLCLLNHKFVLVKHV